MPEESDQRTRRIQVAAVGAEVNAGQRDFLETRRDDALDLAQQCSDGNASRSAASRGNDAVRAGLGAAGLDTQRKGRPTGDARFDRRAAGTVAGLKIRAD